MALFSHLSEIHPGNTQWAVRGRIVRMYKQPAYMNKDQLGSLELVIHDEHGNRIHATMKASLYERIGQNLVEGSMYIIRNFIVIENRNAFKTTMHRYKICLYRLSKMTEFKDENFPSFMYNFTDFGQLTAENHPNDSYLIGVIGRVVSYQKPLEGLTKTRVQFRLQDTDNRQISCTLWNEYADDFLPILENTQDKPVIVIIQFARIQQFRNEITISNTDRVTKVTVNEESEVFLDFMNRLSANETGDFKMLTNSDYDIYEDFAKGKAKFRILQYLNDHPDDAYYWVDATVVDIQTTKDWWYLACKKCAKKINEEVGLVCDLCGEENINQI
ncbi:hypothetical protein CASFOL_012312 [Castilleja foliolosa]|uniref:Replication protein A 70 kDa DNA-binding subunit B/D first OB fold domain-containing protein n=1 Tax=Castilleja foliolosa TaxID=1961234 RepID=A0ABD3DU41_9LAMI